MPPSQPIDACVYCGQQEGHSRRCSVTKFGAPEIRFDASLSHVRGLMCSPGGRDYVERQVLRPFGYVMADAETSTSAVEMPLEEMGG